MSDAEARASRATKRRSQEIGIVPLVETTSSHGIPYAGSAVGQTLMLVVVARVTEAVKEKQMGAG